MLSDLCHTFRFASHRRIGLVLAAAFVLGCGSALGAMEKPVELRDLRGKIVRWGSIDYVYSTNEHGSCAVVMVVDPVSGNVTSDYIESSSGDHYLNYKALEMMKKFKFKPGSPRRIRTTFGMSDSSWWRNYKPDRESQPLSKILKPFLGKNALVEGSLPDYPRDKPWTDKHGTGVFELHVARTGEVTSVAVKKFSGDPPFDEVMVRAMRQWRFRKGPVEIELPLYFALTPQKFSVRIPKYP